MKTRYYLCLAFIIIICASGIIFYLVEKEENDPYKWVCNLDGNLTDIQLKDRALKCMLKDWHFFYNFNKREYDRRIKAVKKEYDDTANEIGGGVEIRYSECHSDKRPDDKCEFYKIDKRLNLDYLMDLGSKICRNGKAIQDAETHIDKEIFNTEVVYPWEDKESLVLEDGSLKYGIFFNYIDEDD